MSPELLRVVMPRHFEVMMDMADYATEYGIIATHTDSARQMRDGYLWIYALILYNLKMTKRMVDHFLQAGEDEERMRHIMSCTLLGRLSHLSVPGVPAFVQGLIGEFDIDYGTTNDFKQNALHLLFDNETDPCERVKDWHSLAKSLAVKLLTAGVDPNGIDCEGWTPSHYIRSELSWQIWTEALSAAGQGISRKTQEIHANYQKLGIFVTSQCCCGDNRMCNNYWPDQLDDCRKPCQRRPTVALRRDGELDEQIEISLPLSAEAPKQDFWFRRYDPLRCYTHRHITDEAFDEKLNARRRAPGSWLQKGNGPKIDESERVVELS